MDYNISFDYSNAKFMVSDDNLKAMSKRVLDAKEVLIVSMHFSISLIY